MQSHLCNRGGGNPCTPIFIAIIIGDIEIVRLLISSGADVNAFTPICLAIFGDIEIVRLLIAAGADVNAATT
jgi:ankyrin repeat protein